MGPPALPKEAIACTVAEARPQPPRLHLVVARAHVRAREQVARDRVLRRPPEAPRIEVRQRATMLAPLEKFDRASVERPCGLLLLREPTCQLTRAGADA